jgi:membrane protein DedA with SNARE-associated domain
MNAALAGRMAVWTILAIVAYGLLVYAVARFMAWVSKFYPLPSGLGEDVEDESEKRAS